MPQTLPSCCGAKLLQLLSHSAIGSHWRCSGPPTPSLHSVHQTFISGLDSRQVAEGQCGNNGPNKAVSVERVFIWKEQCLEPLALFD
jgi:hypothetical protein